MASTSSNDKARILERTLDKERVKLHLSTLFLLPYVPIGCLIAILRFCLLINFLIAQNILRLFLNGDSLIMTKITQLFLLILGICVQLHGNRLPAEVMICNRRSGIDRFILCFMLDVFSVDAWNWPSWILPLLRLLPQRPRRAGKNPPTVLFPEKYATTGQCVTPFQPWYLQGRSSIQPIAISYWRLLPLAISTISSNILSDTFCMFFNPFTIVNVYLSSECIHCVDDDSTESCCSAAMRTISNLLKKPILDVSLKELSQYVDSLTPLPDDKIPALMLTMVKKVEEVTPHVPRNVIIVDLKKTGSVDVTLANIFEGVVDFIPINTGKSPQRTPSKSSQQNRQLSPFERRKAELMETARRRYKEKHEL